MPLRYVGCCFFPQAATLAGLEPLASRGPRLSITHNSDLTSYETSVGNDALHLNRRSGNFRTGIMGLMQGVRALRDRC